MKRIVIAFLLFSSLYGNAQQQTGAKEYHMAFHRQNKTIGFVLLGAGTGLITYAL